MTEITVTVAFSRFVAHGDALMSKIHECKYVARVKPAGRMR